MKHIICYSGGHSSALVAIEVTRKFGKENVILLNHNINSRYENKDIKRFKTEVSTYLGIPITYANVNGINDPEKIPNQFEVCEKKGTFVNPANRQILCTYVLKTEPFYKYLDMLTSGESYIIYYGFDDDEIKRVDRRKAMLNDKGFQSDYPMALWGGKENILKHWYVNQGKDYEVVKKIENYVESFEYERTIESIKEIGIEPPNSYSKYKHANCTGCLKAGQQHWYVVYCTDYEIFERGKLSEKRIGHSFGKEYLKDLEPKFKKMKEFGIPADENIPSGLFWKSAKTYLNRGSKDMFPCECFI